MQLGRYRVADFVHGVAASRHLRLQVRSKNELQFEGLSDAGVGALSKLRSYRQVMIVLSFVLRTLSIYGDNLLSIYGGDMSFEVRKELYSAVQYILSFASCFAVLHLLEAMSQSEDISVLIIMIDRMVNDLSVFVKLGYAHAQCTVHSAQCTVHTLHVHSAHPACTRTRRMHTHTQAHHRARFHDVLRGPRVGGGDAAEQRGARRAGQGHRRRRHGLRHLLRLPISRPLLQPGQPSYSLAYLLTYLGTHTY